MPNLEELSAEHEAELAAMDAELADLPGVTLEDVFKLGQENPGKTLSELAAEITVKTLSPETVTDFHKVWPAPRDYSGPHSIALGQEAEDQDPLVVGVVRRIHDRGSALPAVKVTTYAGDLKHLQDISWFDLSRLETQPELQDQLRNRRGRKESIIIREAPVMAFISLMIRAAAEVPDWVYPVVFVSEPHEDRVRFVLGYVQTESWQLAPAPAWVEQIPSREVITPDHTFR